jgi:hypothetical protein
MRSSFALSDSGDRRARSTRSSFAPTVGAGTTDASTVWPGLSDAGGSFTFAGCRRACRGSVISRRRARASRMAESSAGAFNWGEDVRVLSSFSDAPGVRATREAFSSAVTATLDGIDPDLSSRARRTAASSSGDTERVLASVRRPAFTTCVFFLLLLFFLTEVEWFFCSAGLRRAAAEELAVIPTRPRDSMARSRIRFLGPVKTSLPSRLSSNPGHS